MGEEETNVTPLIGLPFEPELGPADGVLSGERKMDFVGEIGTEDA